MNCTVCRTETRGAFCHNCGAPTAEATCARCEAPLLAGANFCTSCGKAVRATPSQLPWIVAGGALVALIVVLIFPALRPGASGGAGPGFDAGAFPAGATGSAGPLTGTPREQADRLFNRVMQAYAAGDSEQVAFFVPMAVLAYRQAGELDTDGLYHLSILETISGDAESGLATAEQILATDPDHLLALAAAAQAADVLGDRTTASRHYRRLLDVFADERGKLLPEYLDHAQIFDAYREEAEAYLGRSGTD